MKKMNSTMISRAVMGGVVGLGLLVGFSVQNAKADERNRLTTLTVGQTMQIEDTVLQPGKYILRAVESPSNLHVIQIFNSDQDHVYATIQTIPTERSRVTGDTQLTFWETPAGTAKALRDWYYPGRLEGDEFAYPTHLTKIAAAQSSTPPAATFAEATPAPEQAPQAAQQPAAAPAPAPAAQEPVEIAQNSPPPPPATTPAQPSTQAQPSTLPQTASPYPFYGLTGAFLLALYATLRLTGSKARSRS